MGMPRLQGNCRQRELVIGACIGLAVCSLASRKMLSFQASCLRSDLAVGVARQAALRDLDMPPAP